MSLLNRALLWSLAQPLAAGAIFAIVTVFFAMQLPRLEIDASVEGLMLERDPARAYYEQVKRTFGSDSLTLVVIAADDVFTREVLGIVERLSRRLERVEGVTRVESLATVDHVAGGDDGFTTAPLIDLEVPDDAAALARIRTAALGDPIFLRNLVARDGRAMALAVYTDAAAGDRTFNERFSKAVDALLGAEAAPGITLYQVGAPLTKATVVNYLRSDQALLVPLSAVTLFLVLLVAFRTPQGVVVPLVTGLSSVVWGAGLMAIFGIPINMITSAVPSLVLVVGFAEDVHIIAAYHRLLGQGHRKLEALAEAVRETALPVLVTTATTVLAFATLITTDITMLKQFGVAAALALSANFVATLLGVPVMLRLWPVPARLRADALMDETATARTTAIAGRLGDFVLRRRVPIVVCCAALGLVSVYGMSRLRVDTDFINYLPERSPVRQRMRDVRASLAGASAFHVVVESGRENGITDPGLMRKIVELQNFLERQPGIDSTVSVADYVARLHGAMSGHPGHAPRAIPDSQEMVAQHLLLMDRQQVARFVDLPLSSAAILVRHDLTGSWRLSAVLRQLDAFVARHFAGVRVEYTGEAILTNRAADYMAMNEVTSFSYTLLIIGAIHSALFMSIRAGFLSLVPNIIPVLFTFGLMGYAGIPLNTATAMVPTIAIGIAVDDTVHHMVTYSRQLNVLHDQRAAILRTMAIQLRPIVALSLALAAGFSVLTFSNFVPTVHIGLLSAFVMIVALASELVLTPILMSSTRLVTLWNMLLLKMDPKLVKTAPLFAGLSPWEARKVVLLGMLRSCAPGEYAIRKGEHGRELYMVVTGRVVVLDFEATGAERTMAIVDPGGVFGEAGLVGDGFRAISARAEAPCELLRIDVDALERLRKRFPYTAAKVFRNLARVLSERLQDTTTALLYLSSADPLGPDFPRKIAG